MAGKKRVLTSIVLPSLLAALGVSAVGAQKFFAEDAEDNAREAMMVMQPCVYGGPDNTVTVRVCGKVLDERNGKPLAGIRVRIFMNQNYLLKEMVTQDDGAFYFSEEVWTGSDEKKYRIVLGEWTDEVPLADRTVVLGKDEVYTEETFKIKVPKK